MFEFGVCRGANFQFSFHFTLFTLTSHQSELTSNIGMANINDKVYFIDRKLKILVDSRKFKLRVKIQCRMNRKPHSDDVNSREEHLKIWKSYESKIRFKLRDQNHHHHHLLSQSQVSAYYRRNFLLNPRNIKKNIQIEHMSFHKIIRFLSITFWIIFIFFSLTLRGKAMASLRIQLFRYTDPMYSLTLAKSVLMMKIL